MTASIFRIALSAASLTVIFISSQTASLPAETWWWPENATFPANITTWTTEEISSNSSWWQPQPTNITYTTNSNTQQNITQPSPPWWASSTSSERPVNGTQSPSIPVKVPERKCACNPKKLYLDVVVVVDSSLSMTKDGLLEIAADLATLFQRMTISAENHVRANNSIENHPQTNVSQYVRVGLVTFSSYPLIVGSFDSFRDYISLVDALFRMPYHADDGLNIQKALQLASDMLQDSRSYAKTAILLYTSAYREGGFTDARMIANQIKESGTMLITVAFRQQPEGSLVQQLAHLASRGSSFGSMDPRIIDGIVHALCRANCYCKSNWMQYSDDLHSPTELYGECIRAMDIDASWMTASSACKEMAHGAHLVNELTFHKHNFVSDYARSVLPLRQYSIGLRYDPLIGDYAWETASTTKIPYSAGEPNNWRPGYPNTQKGDCVAAIANGIWDVISYQNVDCLRAPMRYVCQMPACDTENFCTSLDV